MKENSLWVLLSLLTFFVNGQAVRQNIPHLRYKNGYAELSVNGRPFLMRAGELGNSSASSIAYMKPVWPRLVKMHLNTLLTPIYWELLEPREGKFDFSLVDAMLTGARSHNMKLVFLWFGTWKNSMSCYAPAWIKTDQERFPRVAGSTGRSEEIITPFSENALIADKKAFTALMRHIKEVDGQQHTVLMIQVENEIGMLPEARDHSQPADAAFQAPVPAKLMDYLTAHRNTLVPEIKKLWEGGGYKTSGAWEDIFGKSLATDELFMAWYFGIYVDEIARAGKAVYDIPMYVNAALNASGQKAGRIPRARGRYLMCWIYGRRQRHPLIFCLLISTIRISGTGTIVMPGATIHCSSPNIASRPGRKQKRSMHSGTITRLVSRLFRSSRRTSRMKNLSERSTLSFSN